MHSTHAKKSSRHIATHSQVFFRQVKIRCERLRRTFLCVAGAIACREPSRRFMPSIMRDDFEDNNSRLSASKERTYGRFEGCSDHCGMPHTDRKISGQSKRHDRSADRRSRGSRSRQACKSAAGAGRRVHHGQRDLCWHRAKPGAPSGAIRRPHIRRCV